MCFTESQQGKTGTEREMESKGRKWQLSSRNSPKRFCVDISAVWTEPEGQELFKETQTKFKDIRLHPIKNQNFLIKATARIKKSKQ